MTESGTLGASRVFCTVLLSALLLELAWMLAVPAFRGPDEVDHAFRADSLVHGQLLGREVPEDGRGKLVTVSADLARAAGPVCESYAYTRPDNCRPAGEVGRDRVSIASSAATYNPSWYAVAGTAALPFEGTAALIAMRVPGAVGVALLVAWAAVLLTRDDRSGRTLVGLLLVSTPIVAYSAVVAAPNALATGGGVLLWSAVVALLRRPEEPPLVALVLSVALLAHTHSTGPVWLAVTTLSLLVLRPPRWWTSWVRSDPWPRATALVAAGLACLTAVAWIRWAGTNGLGEPVADTDLPAPSTLLAQLLVWLCQTVGAFPERDVMAPVAAYVLWLVPLGALVAVGVRAADGRTRHAVALLATAWVAVPIGLTLVSYRSEGFAWQGRYAMPLVAGLVLLASASAAEARRPSWPWIPATVVSTALAHAACAVAMASRTAGEGTTYAVVDHVPGALWLIGLSALVGGAAPLLLARRPATDPATRASVTDHALEATP